MFPVPLGFTADITICPFALFSWAAKLAALIPQVSLLAPTVYVLMAVLSGAVISGAAGVVPPTAKLNKRVAPATNPEYIALTDICTPRRVAPAGSDMPPVDTVAFDS